MAGTVDLTTAGKTATVNGAVFTNQQATGGTGVFDTFVQLQHNGIEQGYNTDGTLQQDQGDVQYSTYSTLLA